MSHVLADAFSFWHRYTPKVSHRVAHEWGRRTTTGPPLASGERILREFTNDTERLVATDRALYRVGATDDWSRIAWSDIEIVGWSRTEHALTLRLLPSSVIGHEIRIPGDAALAAFADERVAASRLLVTHAEIRPGVIATVIAVRVPDDETVRWWVLVNDDDAAGDPAFHEACARVVAELRGLTGC